MGGRSRPILRRQWVAQDQCACHCVRWRTRLETGVARPWTSLLPKVKGFLRRITLPIVLAVIGTQLVLLNCATFKRREFEYITREGSSRTFSSAQNPSIYDPSRSAFLLLAE